MTVTPQDAPPQPIPPTPAALAAVTKFLQLNDDMPACEATNRKVFFEALRTGTTLSPNEVEHLHSIADFLAELNAIRLAS